MYSYILRSYIPTSHISKFSSCFISYAGLGIYSTISSYAGGAVCFRTAKVLERVLSERCVYIDFAHGLFSIGALDMPKNVPRRRKWSLGNAHCYLGEIKRFRLEWCWQGKSLDFDL